MYIFDYLARVFTRFFAPTAFLLLVVSPAAHADITIPVTSGSSPTCLGRLYSDILGPSNWGSPSDNTAATRFAQSDQGTLGFTIFFEVRPNAGLNAYSSGGSTTMNAVGYTALNRNISIGFVSSHYTTFKAKTKNMSGVWVNTYDGSGNLQSGQAAALPGILNEAPTSQNCNGLIYSLQMGQIISSLSGGGNDYGHPPSASFSTWNYEGGVLWFNSNGAQPSGSYVIGYSFAPRYPSGTYQWYYYGKSGIQTTTGGPLY